MPTRTALNLSLWGEGSFGDIGGNARLNWSYSRRETVDQCLRRYFYQYYAWCIPDRALRDEVKYLLNQGTAEPLVIVSESGGCLAKVTEAVAVGAQLNWSSPTVAQRLPLLFKRTDEELEIRAAQEIRRIA